MFLTGLFFLPGKVSQKKITYQYTPCILGTVVFTGPGNADRPVRIRGDAGFDGIVSRGSGASVQAMDFARVQ